jgi:uncharacterized integral membrane protein
MLKLASKLVLLSALLIVLLFAALNSTMVEINVLAYAVSVPLGVGLVAFFAMGSLAGAIGLYLAVVMRLKRELRVAQKTKA